MIIAVDIGTTNMKAAYVNEAGAMTAPAFRPNESLTDGAAGYVYYDPERLWENAAALIREAAAKGGARPARAVSITSMAESGMLVDRRTGRPRSRIMPWFERCALPQAARIAQEVDVYARFCRTGVYPSPKQGLAKLLWLRETQEEGALPSDCVWLSVSAYVAFRLTGAFAEDYTLAARTYAFRMDRREWDGELLRQFGLPPELFPRLVRAGEAVGEVPADRAEQLGLAAGAQVCLAGHDHVCASVAVGAVKPGRVYNSMGTAETMVGTFDERPLGRDDYESGLSYGLHAAEGQMFWMGGHSSSGGSVEWLRALLGEQALSYADIMRLLDASASVPTGILFYPYLAGSGAPHPDPAAKAAFLGLTAAHGRAELLRAVLEGNAYQMEAIRSSAERAGGTPIRAMHAVGGGVNNPHWLQIKADVSGIPFTVPAIAEAALLGAALCGGVGAGMYGSFAEAAEAVRSETATRYAPDADRHAAYRAVYEREFVPLRRALFAREAE